MTDNSYMFVDEDKEDISEAGGIEPKGKYLDKSVTGKIEDESTINLVADEDVVRELSFQERLEKKASDLQENIHENLKNNIKDNIKDNTDSSSSVALNSERIIEKGKGFGVASLICGIISLTLFCSIFNVFSSLLSIIFGIVHIRRGGKKGIAIFGMLCSVCSIILLIICMTLIMSNTAFLDMITSSMLNMGIFSVR
ncbi:MAG: DUF4190 domain-containing protein [Lachnospiraceae bacterium]|nr:DUF4190 domain-containing protein [Lachnospiraceae bacterium]